MANKKREHRLYSLWLGMMLCFFCLHNASHAAKLYVEGSNAAPAKVVSTQRDAPLLKLKVYTDTGNAVLNSIRIKRTGETGNDAVDICPCPPSTGDIARARLYKDSNNNGIVDSVDINIATCDTAVTPACFDGTYYSFTSLGRTIDTFGETYLVTYDIASSATTNRTITALLENELDVNASIPATTLDYLGTPLFPVVSNGSSTKVSVNPDLNCGGPPKCTAGQANLTVTDATGLVGGDFVIIGTGPTKEGKKVLSVAGNVITLTSNLAFPHGSPEDVFKLKPTTIGNKLYVFGSDTAVQNNAGYSYYVIKPSAGTTEVFIDQLRFCNPSSVPVTVNTIKLARVGSASDTDILNVKLYDDLLNNLATSGAAFLSQGSFSGGFVTLPVGFVVPAQSCGVNDANGVNHKTPAFKRLAVKFEISSTASTDVKAGIGVFDSSYVDAGANTVVTLAGFMNSKSPPPQEYQPNDTCLFADTSLDNANGVLPWNANTTVSLWEGYTCGSDNTKSVRWGTVAPCAPLLGLALQGSNVACVSPQKSWIITWPNIYIRTDPFNANTDRVEIGSILDVAPPEYAVAYNQFSTTGAEQGKTSKPVLGVKLTSQSGQISVRDMTLDMLGTSTYGTDVTMVKVYDDVNKNGVFDSGETVLAKSATLSGSSGTLTFFSTEATLSSAAASGQTNITVNSAAGFLPGDSVSVGGEGGLFVNAVAGNVITFTNNLSSNHGTGETVVKYAPLVVSAGTPRYLLVTYDFAIDAVLPKTFGARLTALGISSRDIINPAALPASSATAAITGNRVSITPISLAPRTVKNGTTGVSFLQLQTRVNYGLAVVNSIRVDFLGGTGADVAKIGIYDNASGNGFATSTELLKENIGPFGGGNATVDFAAGPAVPASKRTVTGAAQTTLAFIAPAGQPNISVLNAAGFLPGDTVSIGSAGGLVVSSVAGNVITLTSNLLNNHSAGETIFKSARSRNFLIVLDINGGLGDNVQTSLANNTYVTLLGGDPACITGDCVDSTGFPMLSTSTTIRGYDSLTVAGQPNIPPHFQPLTTFKPDVQTTLSASAAKNQPVIFVASTTGFAVNDVVTVGTGSNVDGKTISAINTTTNQITFTSNLVYDHVLGELVFRPGITIYKQQMMLLKMTTPSGSIDFQTLRIRAISKNSDGTPNANFATNVDTANIKVRVDRNCDVPPNVHDGVDCRGGYLPENCNSPTSSAAPLMEDGELAIASPYTYDAVKGYGYMQFTTAGANDGQCLPSAPYYRAQPDVPGGLKEVWLYVLFPVRSTAIQGNKISLEIRYSNPDFPLTPNDIAIDTSGVPPNQIDDFGTLSSGDMEIGGNDISVSGSSLTSGTQNVQQGEKFGVLKLSFSATGADPTRAVVLQKLQIKRTGTSSNSDVKLVSLYEDTNGNGVFDGADMLMSTTAFDPATPMLDTATFSTWVRTVSVLPGGAAQQAILVYTLSTNASGGVTLGADITDQSFLTVSAPDTATVVSAPISSNLVTTKGNTVVVTGSDLAPAKITPATIMGTTTLSSASIAGATVVTIGDASGVSTGDYLRIGSGATQETRFISNVTGNTVTLYSGFASAHALNEPVVTLKSTSVVMEKLSFTMQSTFNYDSSPEMLPTAEVTQIKVKALNSPNLNYARIYRDSNGSGTLDSADRLLSSTGTFVGDVATFPSPDILLESTLDAYVQTTSTTGIIINDLYDDGRRFAAGDLVVIDRWTPNEEKRTIVSVTKNTAAGKTILTLNSALTKAHTLTSAKVRTFIQPGQTKDFLVVFNVRDPVTDVVLGSTTLASAASASANSVSLTDASQLSAGDYIRVGGASNQETKHVTSVVGTTVFLETNLIYNHLIGETVTKLRPTTNSELTDNTFTTVNAPDIIALSPTPLKSSTSTYRDLVTVTPGYDSVTKLCTTTNNTAPANVSLGQTGVPMLTLCMLANTNSALLNSIKIFESGTSTTDSHVSLVSIYKDANGNGQFDPATDTKLATGTFSSQNATLVLSPPPAVDTTTPLVLFAVYDITNSSLATAFTLGARISDETFVTLSSPDEVASANFPVSSTNSNVLNNDTLTVLNTSPATESLAPQYAKPGNNDVPLEKITLSASSASVTVNSIKVNKIGTILTSDVPSVKLYQDVNGNGAFDLPGDAPPLSTTTFDGAGVATFATPFNVSYTQNKVLFVAVDIKSTAPSNESANIAVQLNNGNITVAVPDTMAAFTAFQSGLTTISNKATLTVSGANLAPAQISRGTFSEMQKLTLTVAGSGNSVTATSVKVTRGGSAADADVQLASLYEDQNGDNLATAGELLATGTFASQLVTFNVSPGLVVSSGTPRYLIIGYKISPTASANKTVLSQLTDSSFLTVNSPNVVTFTTSPLSSSASTIIGNKLTVSGVSFAPASIQQEASAVMEQLSLSANLGTIVVSSIKINQNGTSTVDGDVEKTELILDANGNGAYDAGDSVLTTALFASQNATFSGLNLSVVAGAPKKLLVIYYLSSTAAVAKTVGVKLTDTSFVGAVSPDQVVNAGFPITSSLSTIAVGAPDTLTVAAASLAPAQVYQGQTGVAMEKLTLTAAPKSVFLTGITLTESGTSTVDTDASSVKIYKDNGDGNFSSASDTLLGSGTFTAQSSTIAINDGGTGSLRINSSSPQVLFVVYDVAAAATLTQTLGMSIANETKLAVNAPDTVTPFPGISSSTSTIIPPPKTVTVAGTNIAPVSGSVEQAQQNVAMLKLNLSTPTGTATLTSLKIDQGGTSTLDTDISQVKLYLDTGNGTFETTDTLLASGTLTSKSITFSSLNVAVAAGAAKDLFVVYDISPSSSTGVNIDATVTAANSVTLVFPDIVAGTFPAKSNQVTIGGNTVTVAGTSLAPAAPISLGQTGIAMEKLSFSVASGAAVMTQLKINKTGSSTADSDVSAAKLYLDEGNGVFDGTEALLLSTTFTSSAAIFGGLNVNIAAGAPKTVFVIYDISASSNNGVDFKVKLTDATFVTVTAPDTVASTGFPFESNAASLPDTIAPAAIINLAASAGTNHGEVVLTWTAPGDDGNKAGTAAAKYTIKYSTSGAIDEAAWASLPAQNTITNTLVPKTQGSAETFTVTGLTECITYYFAIKAEDEILLPSKPTPNVASISNSPNAQARDKMPPAITHTPVIAASANSSLQQPIPIPATIADGCSVASATLFYRKTGDTAYLSANMTLAGTTYSASIPLTLITDNTSGIDYYIEAKDPGNNASDYPATAPATPKKIGTFKAFAFAAPWSLKSIFISAADYGPAFSSPTAGITQGTVGVDAETSVPLTANDTADTVPPVGYTGKYTLVCDPTKNTLSWKIKNLTETFGYPAFTAQCLNPSLAPQAISSMDGKLLLNVPEAAVKEEVVVTVIPIDTIKVASTPEKQLAKMPSYVPRQPEKLLFVGGSYQVGPNRYTLEKEAQLALAYDEAQLEGLPAEKLGLYAWNDEKLSWDYLDGSAVNKESKKVAAATSILSTYRIILDNVAPEVKNLKPSAKDKELTRMPEVSADISDLGSGVDPKSVSMFIDENPVPVKVDIVKGKLSYIPAAPLSAGEHSLTIVVKDKVGNETRLEQQKLDIPGDIKIERVFNAPNPVRSWGEIAFQYEVDEVNAKFFDVGGYSVTIEVYTLNGKRIAVLDNSTGLPTKQKVGNYIRFKRKAEEGVDIPHLPNGVYIFRLLARDFEGKTISKVNKMVIAR